jgi:serine/threonine protein kinase
MGEVYKARDTRLRRELAIKLLRAGKIVTRERAARLMQEARAASALNHPHIITIHDVGAERGFDFLVMEYVKGRPLDQLIPRQGMPVREVLRLSSQIADAQGARRRYNSSRPQAFERYGNRRRPGQDPRFRIG